MNREDIMRMAADAGVSPVNDQQIKFEGPMWLCLERFAALVAAEKEQQMIRDGYRKCAEGQRMTQFCGLLDAAVKAERDACAEICRAYAMPDGTSITAMVLEKAILARSKL